MRNLLVRCLKFKVETESNEVKLVDTPLDIIIVKLVFAKPLKEEE